jgi:transcriptional regulator with PAS, ATPase and Fis domain
LLTSQVLQHYGRKHVASFEQAAVKALLNDDYPGNSRELQNLIERAVIIAPEGSLLEVRQLFTGGRTATRVCCVQPNGHLAGAVSAPAPLSHQQLARRVWNMEC